MGIVCSDDTGLMPVNAHRQEVSREKDRERECEDMKS
jgi:hypothetical protein